MHIAAGIIIACSSRNPDVVSDKGSRQWRFVEVQGFVWLRVLSCRKSLPAQSAWQQRYIIAIFLQESCLVGYSYPPNYDDPYLHSWYTDTYASSIRYYAFTIWLNQEFKWNFKCCRGLKKGILFIRQCYSCEWHCTSSATNISSIWRNTSRVQISKANN